MSTLLQHANARRDSALVAKTEAALLLACKTVRGESDQTPNHAERLACANACYVDPAYRDETLDGIMVEVANVDAIAADPGAATDQAIQDAVDGAFTAQAVNHPPAV